MYGCERGIMRSKLALTFSCVDCQPRKIDTSAKATRITPAVVEDEALERIAGARVEARRDPA